MPRTFRTRAEAQNAVASMVFQRRADTGHVEQDFSAFGGSGGFRAHVRKGATTWCVR